MEVLAPCLWPGFTVVLGWFTHGIWQPILADTWESLMKYHYWVQIRLSYQGCWTGCSEWRHGSVRPTKMSHLVWPAEEGLPFNDLSPASQSAALGTRQSVDSSSWALSASQWIPAHSQLRYCGSYRLKYLNSAIFVQDSNWVWLRFETPHLCTFFVGQLFLCLGGSADLSFWSQWQPGCSSAWGAWLPAPSRSFRGLADPTWHSNLKFCWS